MRLLALVVVGVIGCEGTRPAQLPRSPASIEHRDMLAAMERYLAAPLEAGSDARARINAFAAQNHDVLVVVEEAVTPFLTDDLDPEAKHLLLTGFIAGNTASQLRAGAKRDDLVAGVDGELKVYRALLAAVATTFQGRKVRSPRLDVFLELEAKGQLRAHLERVRAERERGAASAAAGSGSSTDNSADEALAKLAMEGVRRMQAGSAEEAITGYFDKVIASYQQRYRTEKRRIYCARSPAESLMYMLESANKGEEAIAISPLWADAWFFKSYALSELHRPADARAALEQAIALSPYHAFYLNEFGFLHQKANDWQRSLEIYKSAEDLVGIISDPANRAREHARSLRGQGHALIELGDLDAAEKKFQHSLTLEPSHTRAKQNLEYIRDLRTRKAAPSAP